MIARVSTPHNPPSHTFHIADDGFMVGHARDLGNGYAEWYPGNSHMMRCKRKVSELSWWKEETLFDDEVFVGTADDEDTPEQALQDCWRIIECLLAIIAKRQAA